MDKICHKLRQAGTAILFFLVLIPFLASAQTQQITLKNKAEGIREILKQVEKQSGYIFIYTRSSSSLNKAVKLNKTTYTLAELFRELGEKASLSFRISDNNVIVREQPTGSVKGQLNDEKGKPVPYATLQISGKASQANENGYFQLENIPEGKQTISVSYMGAIVQQQLVEIRANEIANIKFIITENQKQLKEVNVSAKTEAQKVHEKGFNANVLDATRFNNTNKDLNQLLNASTGVRIREQGGLGSGFNFSLNGLSGKAVRFFVDGIPMENYGAGMTFNNIPVNLANRLEVYKGVVPVELGADALGGAVNMVTAKGPGNYLDASYSVGSFNTHRAALSSQYRNDSTGLVVKLSGFYNYSDNNYLMRSNPKYDAAIQVPDGNGGFAERDVKRFHDQYRSAMAQGEVGFVNKCWADVFMVGFLYNNHYKQFQTGATQNIVYGKIDRRGDYMMPSMRYKKSDLLIKGLDLTAFVSYGIDKYAVTDTSTNTYWWDGTSASSGNTHGEFAANTPRTITNFTNTFLLGRINLDYTLNANNKVTLNFNHNSADRKSNEELSNKTYSPSGQGKSIVGLSLENLAANGKLRTTAFAKMFHFNVNIGAITDGKSPSAAQDRDYNNYGYGLASRYALSRQFGIRGSYEHTYRLPEQEEILGDGVNIIANLNIKPESSHNVNLGIDFSGREGAHSYTVELGGFYRNATDFIYSIPAGTYSSQYLNEGKVRIIGAEAEAQYKYASLFQITANATYQRSKQTQKYIYGTETPYATYGNMIPNQPWLFGNLFFSLGKNNWLGKDTRLQLDYNAQYLHSFFLTWEAWGSAQSRNIIPSQLLHTAGFTYSFKQSRYNISAECRNLGNELAYDNFRQQKPGRSFNLKLRYFIQ